MIKNACPLCSTGGNLVSKCEREKCAWWLEYAEECTVRAIAEVLIDSDICKTIFTRSTPKGEAKDDD